MTEKQFIADNEYVMQNGQVYVVCGGEHSADVVATALNELISENEQLKEALKELKEIGDYQAMVIQESYDMKSSIEDEIDKKIAVLTDAKIKSFHNGDEELLKKIKFSIQVLRELKEVIKNGDVE